MKSSFVLLVALLASCTTTELGIREAAPAEPSAAVAPDGPILKGRVTDALGRPVAGAKLVLFDGLGVRHPVAEAVTDAKGDYRFDPCPWGWLVERKDLPGVYDQVVGLQFEHPDYVSQDGCWWWDRVVKAGDGKRTRHDIVVQSAGSLVGNVLEEGSRAPVANLSLRLLGVDGNPYLRTVSTDAEGRFLAGGLFPGEYQIEVVTPEGFHRTIGRASISPRQGTEVWLGMPARPVEANVTAEDDV